MRFIGFEREAEAIEWAKAILGINHPVGFCRAMSCVGRNDEFVLVVVMSNFTATNIDLHTAAVAGAEWASPRGALRVFNGVFGYVFDSLKVLRVTGLVKASNTAARRFDEHLGFKLEGVMRKAFNGDDLCIYGFLAEEYTTHKWKRS